MLVQDVRGKLFDRAKTPRRLVSLVPSLTEALFAFGSGERVVGITDYCIHPAEQVAGKTRIGGTKNPRVDTILKLEPDLVLANMEENRRQDVEKLEKAGIRVFVTFARSVRTALDELHTLAVLVDAEEADAILAPIEAEYAAQMDKARQKWARVFCPVWRDPWVTANRDTYLGDLIHTCGGENIFAARERRWPLIAELEGKPARAVAGADTRYPRVTLEQAAALEPDVIILPDEPYRFAEGDVQEIKAVPGLEHARIHLIDGTLVTWYGIRTGRALQLLSRIFEMNWRAC